MSRVCRKCKLEKPDSEFAGKQTCKGCSKKYCEHGRQKAQCLPCGGISVCEHGKQRVVCKACMGSSICEHGKRKHRCLPCGGRSICEHGKLKERCRFCGGTSICEHDKRKELCRLCDGSAFCEHNKRKELCSRCGGRSICEHSKERAQCRECRGSAICEHDKRKAQCVKCSPQNACENCKYVHVPKRYRFHPYCFSCYCVANPDAEIPRKYKIKENHVRDFLREEFKESITMTFDQKVEDGCSARRPDVRIDFGTHTVIVECDENQHKGYSCENKRTMELFQDCGNRPIVFIRFNPDSYEAEGKKYKGCFRPTTLGLKVDDAEFGRRMREVVAYIEKYRLDIPTKEVNVHQLFYDQG